ncbi:MAG: hypothetical protein A3G02_00405 [Candidatus Yanofskybacteria bacterium RIFCSPLOWO2_12_FULL_44_13b]|nr:MAG: hypothetical protein A3G02_00405 [Candidatus Yanofskybacteria bacterium RIFCSPLOWO2_12_FULL_44_13b]
MFNSFLPYEKKFQDWINNRFEHEKMKPETKEFILHILNPERERKLWRNQQEGILRAIYAYEVLGKKSILLNIVTGGGKTAIIAGVIAWLRMAHQIRHFIILNPNVIVRDRLQQDFTKAKIFRDFKFFPAVYSNLLDDLDLHILGDKQAPQGMLESGVVLGNIQQLYSRGGKVSRNLAYIMNFLGDLAVFNDEAHNTPAQEYTNILMQLAKKSKFRLDTTATPDRADNQNPDSEMIYEYGIQDALTDDLIKSVVVYQPDIKRVELTYTDVDTGKQAKVEEIDWYEIDRKGISATQWVTDDKPLKQQIKIALGRLAEQKERAKGRYKPVLFVVAVCIRDAKNVVSVMEKKFNLKTLLVTEESEEAHRREAAHIGHLDSPYDAVVSVLMLREGWDVPEVGIIMLLRKFSSKVYGQQVIGRGLRKVIRDDGEREILAVVDHPKLEHGWLWKLVGAKIKKDVSVDDKFDVEEDLPEIQQKQELIDPEKLIEVPEIEGEIEPDFETIFEGLKEVPVTEDWQKILDAINYPRNKVEITGLKLRGIRKIDLSGKQYVEYEPTEEDEEKPAEKEQSETTYSIDDLREELKDEVLELSSELLFMMGFGSIYKELIYNTVMNHIDKKLFNGKTLGLAEQKDLEFALYKLSEIRRVFMKPGLVPSIIRYPNATE